MRTVLLAVMLTGCAPSLGHDYEYGCAKFTSEIPLIESHIESHINLAMRVIDQKFGRGAFCDMIDTRMISVVANAWLCGDSSGRVCTGESEMIGYLKLSKDGNAIVHEAIHLVESRAIPYDESAKHTNWESNGYFKMDKEFMLTADFLYY